VSVADGRRPSSPVGAGLTSILVGFGRALREEGVVVGTGHILTYCEAMSRLDPTNLADLYWSGRATMLSRHIDAPVYNQVFRSYFLSALGPLAALLKLKVHISEEAESVFDVLNKTEQGEERPYDAPTGLVASGLDILRRKRFGECSPEELEALRRLMARFKLMPPKRRTRRMISSIQGRRPDLRRTIRHSMRTYGEVVEQCWKERRVKRRRLILILDISGSMAEYSRALVQFAYSAARAASGSTRTSSKVEAFCFGTRLTRITPALQKRDPDHAIAEASKAVLDWEGGTKIGESLDKFVRTWGRRGLCRGAIVVICSDGLERGDPELLANSMEKLKRLSHRIIWMNPMKGDDQEYQPNSVGMLAAAPYVDELLSGHDLASLEELAKMLPKLG
jgi:uncharacterized protein with von Willebrand factor type A (vWA) domain